MANRETTLKLVGHRSLGILIPLLFLLKGVSAQSPASIVNSPNNQAITLYGDRQNISFVCEIAQSETWNALGYLEFVEYFSSPEDGRKISIDDRVVYKDFGGDLDRHNNYDVTQIAPGTFSLAIARVAMGDGGKYACVSRNDGKVMRTWELIVIDNEPSCTSDIAPRVDVDDVIRMTCVVTSQGRWYPAVHWSSNKMGEFEEFAVLQHVGRKRSTSWVAKKTITEDDNNGVFVANIYFDDFQSEDLDENEAFNIPAYQFLNQFPPIVVRQGPTGAAKSSSITTSHVTVLIPYVILISSMF